MGKERDRHSCILINKDMYPGVCVEVLVATVVAWVGVWGIADETVQLVESRRARCCIYAALLGGALLVAGLQRSLTVCALL